MAVNAADIPETFFVFVNLLNPMTAHNARLVGSVTSSAWTSAVEDEAFREKYLSGNVDYLPFIPNPSSDQKFLSAYHVRATSEYTNEYNAELTRRTEFPMLPSRLSATYAFGDYATCETVAKKHDWSLSEVEEFQLVSGAPLRDGDCRRLPRQRRPRRTTLSPRLLRHLRARPGIAYRGLSASPAELACG